jgi:protein TonB
MTAKAERRKAADKPAPPQPTPSDAGTGSTTESGLGEGDIRIALLQHFPYPHPDLSALAHGTKGDVILDAVIDDHGKITQLTLVKGLDPSIDQAVIATVRQWLFTPATKDGVPVPSEQEFHFHYERS